MYIIISAIWKYGTDLSPFHTRRCQMKSDASDDLYTGKSIFRYADRVILRRYRPHLAIRGAADPDLLPDFQSRDLLAVLQGDSRAISRLASLLNRNLAEKLVICRVPPLSTGDPLDSLRMLSGLLSKSGKRTDGTDCLQRVRKPDLYIRDYALQQREHSSSILLLNGELVAGRDVLLLQDLEGFRLDFSVCRSRLLRAGARSVQGLILGKVEGLVRRTGTVYRPSHGQILCTLQGEEVRVETVCRDSFTFQYGGVLRERPLRAIGRTFFPVDSKSENRSPTSLMEPNRPKAAKRYYSASSGGSGREKRSAQPEQKWGRRHPQPYWNRNISDWPKEMTGPYGGGRKKK